MSTLTDVALTLSMQLLLAEDNKGTNIVFSPASIYAMLCLIGAGSKGSTEEEILSFLKFKSKDELSSFSSDLSSLVLDDKKTSSRAPRLSFVNGIWCDKSLTLKTSFQQVVDDVYKATLKQVDFKTEAEKVRVEVNLWANLKTNGLIKEILPPRVVKKETRLIFANALYFKATWECQFYRKHTEPYDFHLSSGDSVKVPFMTIGGRGQIVSCFEGFKVLKLPYKQGRDDERCFSMYIFLPDSRDGLRNLVGKASSESGFLDAHLPRKYVEVEKFLIPRFKVSFGFEASTILKQLGLKITFTAGEANLTEMTISDDLLYVEEIYHKSFIKVHEQGTEAAAVTVARMPTGGARVRAREVVDFVADHPFLFLIREDTTANVLFIGHLLDPRPT